jgi:ATP-dependent 26S proteasome regulatory subunit
LKESIRNDAATFFESRERYRQFNIPWKRGLILIGPPGNGKTHMIQALINDLNQPCLYLKSLKARYHNEDYSIRQVFEKARESAPCILVMEDLDALIDDENRSFFLNELDGFRKNEGILAIATTNHPEKLDPAIVDRPSRFDRKYHFDLPAVPERAAYLTWWNQQLQPATRLTESGITSVARDSEGFSFAYLKELALSSIMAWMNESHRPMDVVMAQQVVNLRQQMVSVKPPVMVSPIER